MATSERRRFVGSYQWGEAPPKVRRAPANADFFRTSRGTVIICDGLFLGLAGGSGGGTDGGEGRRLSARGQLASHLPAIDAYNVRSTAIGCQRHSTRPHCTTCRHGLTDVGQSLQIGGRRKSLDVRCSPK